MSLQNRSEKRDTIRTEYNSKADTNPSCIDYKSTEAIEAAGFIIRTSIEVGDIKTYTFEDNITNLTEH